jgi:hypothetical protein
MKQFLALAYDVMIYKTTALKTETVSKLNDFTVPLPLIFMYIF